MSNKAANSIIIALVCSLLISKGTYAQERSTCARTLELAQSVYQRGDLHKVPSLLKGCLTNLGKRVGFTKQERIEALKILTLSHIYREEPKKADSSMLDLLRTDHFFKTNEAIDPKELIALYKTFRTSPLFSFGAKVGVHAVFPNTTKIFYITSSGEQAKSGRYSSMIGIQIGVNVEIPLFKRNTSKAKWSIAPELWYSNNLFSYQNTSLTQNEETGENNSGIEALFNQQSIVLGLITHYQIGNNSILNPYVGLGFNMTYIASTDVQLETQTVSTNNIVNGPSIDFTPHTNPINFDLSASFGVKYKVGEIMITADIRYQHGLTNITNKQSRTNTEAALNYGLELNDFTQNSIMLNIGFLIPYFSPKKTFK